MAYNSRAMAAAIVGGLIGGFAGYLLFTDEGRALRRNLEASLEELSRELISFRGTVERAAKVASEGWKLLNETLGESESQPARYPRVHQTNPF